MLLEILLTSASQHSHDVVTVKVGKDATPFVVHRALLCDHSKFFKNAFTGSFKEAHDREIKLADVAVKIFVTFMNWLYYSKFDFMENLDTHKTDTSEAEESIPKEVWSQLLEMFIFGDKYECAHLCQAVLIKWQLLDLQHISVSPSKGDIEISGNLIARAFEELPQTSPLCQAIAAREAVRVGYGLIPTSDYPAEFWCQAFKALQSLMLEPQNDKDYKEVKLKNIRLFNLNNLAWLDSVCENHGHADGQEATDCPVAKEAAQVRDLWDSKRRPRKT